MVKQLRSNGDRRNNNKKINNNARKEPKRAAQRVPRCTPKPGTKGKTNERMSTDWFGKRARGGWLLDTPKGRLPLGEEAV